ncbi:DUF1254 domain-containing protein [Nocardia acidivorans]|uniref:DUF1254 domain-containing protein n=1 Tax=Nocardia acidivorans TaxID=404580 RepID=UPI000ABDBF3B|nr:DUF1254 domain-containing protein [Nocardia acidivorans]
MDRAFSRRAMLGVAAAAGLSIAACSRSEESSGTSTTSTVSNTDAVAIATDAYIFGYPLVLMHATADSSGPVNRFRHARGLPTAADRILARTNLDTLYSTAWLDLSGEPMVLQVPAIAHGRFWLMQLLDAWSNTVHDPSSMRPRGRPDPPFTYLITGPGWTGRVPDGLTHLPMPTNTVWLLGRVQVDGVDDLPAVRAIQDQLRLAPLPAWLADHGAPTPGAPITRGQGFHTSPVADVAALDGRRFFDRLCGLMAADAPARADAPALKRFAGIGIEPGGSADALRLADLNAAAADARKTIANYVDPGAHTENGWLFHDNLGSYGTDYRLRAATALGGLGAQPRGDAVYPTIEAPAADNDGVPRTFRLRFEPGQLPPADAFWSLTAYDSDNFLVANPAGIYTVGHQAPPVAGPDGAFEVLVQNADPGPAVPHGNWLPIPATGTFSLTLRLYAPRPEATDGSWKPPRLNPVS